MIVIAYAMENRIKALREAKDWTQSDLAEAINVSWQTISRIENAHTRIMPKRELALAEAFGVTPAELYKQGFAPVVADAATTSSVAAAIRQARRQRSLTIKAVADAVNASTEELASWEANAGPPSFETLQGLAALMRVDVAALQRGEVVATDDVPLGEAVFVSDEQPRYAGPRDVEKLGVVAAGDDGDFQFNGAVAEYVSRPRGLIGRAGVFSLEVISDSMYPAYRQHDVVFCDRSEPKVGDDIIIETFPEGGETTGKAYIKRLKRRTKTALVVEQFNPPEELRFDPYSIKHLWRVVPNRELHGF